VEDLKARHAWLGKMARRGIFLALFCAVAFLLTLQAGAWSGPRDVHIPDSLANSMVERWSNGNDRVHIVGGVIGTIQHWIGIGITIGALATFLMLILSLIRRKLWMLKFAGLMYFALTILYPVSPPAQIWASKSVSTATARDLLGIRAAGWPTDTKMADPDKRYMLAQIAFIEGDKATATRLSAGLSGRQLRSPIEAPFRLQFLQGRQNNLSAVCNVSGCLKEPVRFALNIFLALATIAVLGLVIAAFKTRAILNSRCERIVAMSGMQKLSRQVSMNRQSAIVGDA